MSRDRALVRYDTDLASLDQLVEAARGYAVDSRASSTRKAYLGDFASFEAWCARPNWFAVAVTTDAPKTLYVTAAVPRLLVGRRALDRLLAEDCDVVIFGPSNQYVSIDPILCLDGVRDAIAQKPVVALSPIVGGAAIKGPLATMMRDLTGEAASAGAVAAHYRGLICAMVVERGDEPTVPSIPVLGTSTIMRSREDRLRLSREILAFAAKAAR
ncbi:MAG: 2-phospho-L-lactate transferase CofD family protein [Polyangiaceae bacterium]|jgi:2-phospho-L-lactate transferase/gluconeogenesis factor (CofD/UPF0052 family)